ncbi:hypothetical protein AWM79_00435 [Pseudomonas agarici]|uniref:Uncharacterized protein n=1 Tax=Pseudomonas agarici TaxID=46677 RepID=A0A0X8F4Y8_PSEAA|nr:hypothetical protein [Pseudomonas agarici]AMB83856.1 hypothetical protein AWM79_00435 [Pseudomonas agarici]NWB93382.1 hypothetical protein [Pseudomonas agarici]NWC10023.1 hypothetical protein [Pseudomonas agarici]SEL53568.1 hypothetical protein SAMN05216604_12170 [Pseudomonas agarici]
MTKQTLCANPQANAGPAEVNWEEVQKLISIGDHVKFLAGSSEGKIGRKLYEQTGPDTYQIKIWRED